MRNVTGLREECRWDQPPFCGWCECFLWLSLSQVDLCGIDDGSSQNYLVPRDSSAHLRNSVSLQPWCSRHCGPHCDTQLRICYCWIPANRPTTPKPCKISSSRQDQQQRAFGKTVALPSVTLHISSTSHHCRHLHHHFIYLCYSQFVSPGTVRCSWSSGPGPVCNETMLFTAHRSSSGMRVSPHSTEQPGFFGYTIPVSRHHRL
jgi:hypothetical protein